MFTGIVEEIGRVKSIQPGWLVITAQNVIMEMKLGDSIAVNGVCLTVISVDTNSFTVDIMPETLRRTNLGKLRQGIPVNLERPVVLGGRLGGHLVQGHIDDTGRVISLIPEGEAFIAEFDAPPGVLRYIVEKGFIAIDGVSLTVIYCSDTFFTSSIVAYTRQHTILGSRKPGDIVNLEVDILAKYVELMVGRTGAGITKDLLAEHGFLNII